MKWFSNLSKNVRIIITVALWIVGFGVFAVASKTQLSVFSAIGGILLIVAIIFTVLTVKAAKPETRANPAAQTAEQKNRQTPQKVDTSKVEQDFYSKIVGVTFNNADGSSRQKYISSLKAGDELIFRP